MVCKDCKELEKTRVCNCKQRFLKLIDDEIKDIKAKFSFKEYEQVRIGALSRLRQKVEKIL